MSLLVAASNRTQGIETLTSLIAERKKAGQTIDHQKNMLDNLCLRQHPHYSKGKNRRETMSEPERNASLKEDFC